MSEETENVFQTVAVYFVNSFWNNMHDLADARFKDRRHESLDEAYRVTITEYYNAISIKPVGQKINENYITIIRDLHNYFRQKYHNNMSLGDFTGFFTKQLVPREEHGELSSRRELKDAIFKQSILNLVKKFVTFVVTQGMHDVLTVRYNDRRARKAMHGWKRQLVTWLYEERETIHNRTIEQKTGVKIQKPTGGISQEVVLRLQDKIRDLLEEKAYLEGLVNDHVSTIKQLQNLLLQRRTADLSRQMQPIPTNLTQTTISPTTTPSVPGPIEHTPSVPVTTQDVMPMQPVRSHS